MKPTKTLGEYNTFDEMNVVLNNIHAQLHNESYLKDSDYSESELRQIVAMRNLASLLSARMDLFVNPLGE